jgi:hypothetical protein
MSAVVRYDDNGVLLRYYHDELGPQHTAQKPQPSDAERIAVIAAERELVSIEIMFEHFDPSEIARSRFYDAVDIIYRALRLQRPKLGLQAP